MKLWLLALLRYRRRGERRSVVTASASGLRAAGERYHAPRGNQSDAVVVISGSTIASVGTAATGLNVSGVIVPGLIDLHNHYTWNVLPRWTPKVRNANRYEWQEDPEYALRLGGPHYAMIDAGFGCDMIQYAEIKALVNGATAVRWRTCRW